MTAQPAHEGPSPSRPDKNLRAIREAQTLAEDRAGFDAGLRVALDEVRASLDLAKLTEFVQTWWLSGP